MFQESQILSNKRIYVFFLIASVLCSLEGIMISQADIGNVLIDGEIMELPSNGSLELKEGYTLNIRIEKDDVVFSLSKDGENKKSEKVKSGDSFHYFKRVHQDNYRIISIPSFTLENNKI